MARIRQRGNSWNVTWLYGGSRGGASQSCTWPEERYAQQAAAIAKAHGHKITDRDVEKIVLGEPDDPIQSDLPTVAEWAVEYLKNKTRISPGTKHRYRRQLDTIILPAIGHLHLDEATGAHVATLLNELRACDCPDSNTRGPRCAANRKTGGGHGLDDRTVTRYYSLIHAMFAAAAKEYRDLDENPAKRTDWVRDLIAHDDPDAEGVDHVYLSQSEYQLVRSHADADAQPLLDYLIGTGARWGEATAAAVDSIDAMAQPQPFARIHRAWKWRPREDAADDETKGEWYLGSTKGRTRRTIEIGAVLVDSVLPLIAGELGDALLFRAPGGERIDYSNFRARRWEPAVTAAMRCPTHPPLPRGHRVPADQLAGPRCGDNGGVRSNGKVCGAMVARDWDRCKDHCGPARDAVSDCPCPTRLRKRPTIHDLRHSHASWLIKAGEPLIAISKRLGHHSIEITERVYAGILPEVRASIVAALDLAMTPTSPPSATVSSTPGVPGGTGG